MTNKTFKHWLSIALLTLFLSGCYTTSNKKSEWPSSLPEEQIFIDAYQKQFDQGTNESSLKAHLVWIKRFYLGTIIYPIGWNDMTEMVMASLADSNAEEQEATRERLNLLGQKISIEWAQSNKHRNITSGNIATWANAMRTSVKQDNLFTFLDQVEDDVDDLISRQLHMNKITRERYYPPENFDDF